jgi:hypothetical protein
VFCPSARCRWYLLVWLPLPEIAAGICLVTSPFTGDTFSVPLVEIQLVPVVRLLQLQGSAVPACVRTVQLLLPYARARPCLD